MHSKVVLFDRDGTLIAEPPDERVKSIEDIVLFPDTISALKHLAEKGFSIILVTNQAGIAEGTITLDNFHKLNDEVVGRLEKSGIKVLKTYMCPHGPDDNCDCRKPSPKMLNQAIAEFGLDKALTFMVGDRDTDITAGKSAGLKTILVETALSPATDVGADFTAGNLAEAANIIISSAETITL